MKTEKCYFEPKLNLNHICKLSIQKLNHKLSIQLDSKFLITVWNTLKYFFSGVPHLANYILISFQLLNEPELGEGIDPDMALTPFQSSIVLDKIRTHDHPIVSHVR